MYRGYYGGQNVQDMSVEGIQRRGGDLGTLNEAPPTLRLGASIPVHLKVKGWDFR